MGGIFSSSSSSSSYNLDDHGHKDRSLYEEYIKSDDKFNDMTNKTVAITGTSAGSLGFYIAEVAIRKNAKLLLCLNRDSNSAKKGEEELKKVVEMHKSPTKIEHVTCDMQKLDVVKEASQKVNDTAKANGGLDVLINNAGIMATRDKRTSDGFEIQMQTNQISHFYLTSLIYPSLEMAAEKRGEARCVTHTSSARMAPGGDLKEEFFKKSEPNTLGGDATWMISEIVLGYNGPWTRYHMTKLANSVFAMAMHDKLAAKGSKVKALTADPGVASSNLQVSSTGGDGLMSDWQAKFFVGQGHSAEDGSLCAAMAAFGKDTESGDFYMPEGESKGPPKKTLAGGVETGKKGSEKLTISDDNKTNLWKWCEEATGVKFDI